MTDHFAVIAEMRDRFWNLVYTSNSSNKTGTIIAASQVASCYTLNVLLAWGLLLVKFVFYFWEFFPFPVALALNQSWFKGWGQLKRVILRVGNLFVIFHGEETATHADAGQVKPLWRLNRTVDVFNTVVVLNTRIAFESAIVTATLFLFRRNLEVLRSSAVGVAEGSAVKFILIFIFSLAATIGAWKILTLFAETYAWLEGVN